MQLVTPLVCNRDSTSASGSAARPPRAASMKFIMTPGVIAFKLRVQSSTTQRQDTIVAKLHRFCHVRRIEIDRDEVVKSRDELKKKKKIITVS